ncbi:unnamed protein product [Paramecium octaurelia]|uniref:Uncharacterized protein n=1 Tax=Paramecium octaurelia TaxID=43137 RepID=A0A8S1XFI8_PAROT|nr:unnamed protein product [Paramecium octaurelia]
MWSRVGNQRYLQCVENSLGHIRWQCDSHGQAGGDVF